MNLCKSSRIHCLISKKKIMLLITRVNNPNRPEKCKFFVSIFSTTDFASALHNILELMSCGLKQKVC